jgi:protein CpxP
MKKIVFIALALVAFQLTAQDKKERPNRERGEKMERYQDYTPEEIANLQTKKMTLHLNLNESQQKEIKELNLENAISRETMMKAHKAQKESGNMEKPSKEARLKMMNDRLDRQIERKGKMKKILNADQFTKWEKSQEEMKNKHYGMHKEKSRNK